MIQLYINNMPAVIKTGSNFTLVRENPFFTDSGDYTYDVTLPMSGCLQNLRIFGAINRIEMGKSDLVERKFPFHLVAPPVDIKGNAVVIDVNPSEIKLQLLAGTSSFNSDQIDSRREAIYIDELNLGMAYEDIYPEVYEKEDRYFHDGSHRVVSPRAGLMTRLHNEEDDKVLFGNHKETKCVNFPIYSLADQQKANDHSLFKRDMDGQTKMKYRFPSFRPSFAYLDKNMYMMAAQPYLIDIVTSVIKSMGYVVPDDSNGVLDTWMEHIFIANCKSEYRLNRILPHWTVSEFFKEVRQFFGVFFQVKDKSIAIVKKADYYSTMDNVIEIHDVIDDYSVQISEENAAKDMSFANLEYEQASVDDMLRLPDKVWENAIIKHYVNNAEMISKEAEVPEAQKKESPFVLVDDDDKKVYAYLQSKDPQKNGAFFRANVDCCPPLIRHGEQFGPGHRDADISLRIVPAVMDWINVNFAISTYNGREPIQKVYENAIAMPMICSSFSRDNNLDHFSVDAEINTDAEVTNEEKDIDVIEVAYNAGINVNGANDYSNSDNRWQSSFLAEGEKREYCIPIALGIAYVKQSDGFYEPVICPSNNDQFNMLNTNGQCINTSALSQGFRIDTRCKHIISFLDEGFLDPTSVFLIRGKKYACEKIEMVIDERGLKKVKKGTFYEIN